MRKSASRRKFNKSRASTSTGESALAGSKTAVLRGKVSRRTGMSRRAQWWPSVNLSRPRLAMLRNAVHSNCRGSWVFTMKQLKDETLSIRTSADIKQLLRLAAAREHRSVASMMEVMVLAYAEEHGLRPTESVPINAGEQKKKHGTD